MKPFSEMREDELAAALRAVRPEPSPAFGAELDERAAAGFPRRSPQGEAPNPFARLLAWLRSASPRQALIPAGGLAIAAIAVATIVISGNSSVQRDSQTSNLPEIDVERAAPPAGDASGGGGATGAKPAPLTQPTVPPSSGPMEDGASSGAGSTAKGYSAEGGKEASGLESAPSDSRLYGNDGAASDKTDRDVERAAEITLGTKPGEVGEASSKVFETVHAYDGVVLNSSTTNGSGADAEASFELLIPSGRLGDAMAAFSRIGEVRSRHESTLDITAPTVGAGERLEDSEARIESLLGQLSETDTEPAREIVESELSYERAHAARIKSHLTDLKRRANLSRVELRIESGKGALSPAGKDDGKWGVGDAFGDASNLLAIAAGVAIIALAVLVPVALLIALGAIAARAWTRRARERALT